MIHCYKVFLCLPKRTAHKVQITVRNAPLPTWHRGSVSDWFAGTRTRSSCCGSSSALAGHGFWPQIERNLGMKRKVANLVLCLQRVRNAAPRRQPFAPAVGSLCQAMGRRTTPERWNTVQLLRIIYLQTFARGKEQISYFPKHRQRVDCQPNLWKVHGEEAGVVTMGNRREGSLTVMKMSSVSTVAVDTGPSTCDQMT